MTVPYRERPEIQEIAEVALEAFWAKVREVAPLDVWEDAWVVEREHFALEACDAIGAFMSSTTPGIVELLSEGEES